MQGHIQGLQVRMVNGVPADLEGQHHNQAGPADSLVLGPPAPAVHACAVEPGGAHNTQSTAAAAAGCGGHAHRAWVDAKITPEGWGGAGLGAGCDRGACGRG